MFSLKTSNLREEWVVVYISGLGGGSGELLYIWFLRHCQNFLEMFFIASVIFRLELPRV